jgi:glyoxylase-like metal-dependent hydrolase (beta-lactamase superfamily II)
MGKIAPGVHVVDGVGTEGRPGTVNVCLLIDGDDVTLVDAGYAGSGAHVAAYFELIGLDPGAVRRIVITHHHQDHTGGLAEAVELTGAEVWAHVADAGFIDGSVSRPAPPPAVVAQMPPGAAQRPPTRPVPVRLALVGGEVLGVLGGCRIIHTPGHTPGHLSLLLPELSLLIAGDMLRYEDGHVRRPPEMYGWDLGVAEETIHAVAGLEFERMLPYHGEYLGSQASEAVRRDLRLE